jgi:hypothetical protein
MLPKTIDGLVADIRSVLRLSASVLQSVPPPAGRSHGLAKAVWARADGLALAAIHNIEAKPPFVDIVGQIARTLWEGMVTVEYVGAAPDTRIEQMLVGALNTSSLLQGSDWGKQAKAAGLRPEEAAVVERARKRERAYHDARKELQQAGKPLPPFDHDQCAQLPSIEVMARAIGAHDQYEVMYRLESSSGDALGTAGACRVAATFARIHGRRRRMLSRPAG